MKRMILLASAFLGSLGLTLALFLGVMTAAGLVHAAPAATTRYVAPGGNCGGASPCYASVQAAVDAAQRGDEIRVAAGVYTDISARPRADVTTTGVVTQVVYLAKTVTVRGGYIPGNWITSNPTANPTTLDARGRGRVLYITGAINPTIEGLRLTGGRADTDDWYEGGGVYAITATVLLRDNGVFDNSAEYGGGVYLENADNTTLTGNQIYGNVAADEGGGICVWESAGVTLVSNLIHDNAAEGNSSGGGWVAVSDGVTLSGNQIYSNTSAGDSGGFDLSNSADAVLIDNLIFDNRAEGNGGGVHLSVCSGLTVRGNQVHDNTAAGDGGGVHLSTTDGAMLTDNQIYGNHADGGGGGVYLSADFNTTLTGNQIHDNAAYDGGGVDLWASDAAALTGSSIYGNRADGDGGGIHFTAGASPALTGNRVYANTAGGIGGGVYLLWADAGFALAGNQIYSNTAAAEGGGICCMSSDNATLTANRIYGNTAGAEGGGGVYFVNCHNAKLVNNAVLGNRLSGSGGRGPGILADYVRDLRLLHTTLARNGPPELSAASDGDGSALFVTDSIGASGPPASSVALTNTILAGQSVGIHVTTGNRVAIDGILWYNTPVTVTKGATATVTVANQRTGDPAFAADGYHLTASSAAIDRGVDAGVTDDIDGDTRPQGAGFDLGADEWLAPRRVYLPLVLK